jgi:hypothetical protein
VEIINTVLALDKLINIFQSARLALTEKCNFIKVYKKAALLTIREQLFCLYYFTE